MNLNQVIPPIDLKTICKYFKSNLNINIKYNIEKTNHWVNYVSAKALGKRFHHRLLKVFFFKIYIVSL